MSAQGNAIFPRIELAPEALLQALPDLVRVRSRLNALLTAIEEFGIIEIDPDEEARLVEGLAGNRASQHAPHPALDEIALQRMRMKWNTGEIRRIAVATVAGSSGVDWLQWEDSPIGRFWKSHVVLEGDDVASLLVDGFRANDYVAILDPALTNGRPRSKAARHRIYDLCAEHAVQRLEVCSESGMGDDAKPPAQVLVELDQELAACNFKKHMHVTWKVRCHDGAFHDRYVAFGKWTRRGLSALHTVTIGTGISAVVPANQPRPTLVARLPSEAFGKARGALDRLRWQATLDREFAP